MDGNCPEASYILLVDDEESLVRVVATLLKKQGFQVLNAHTALEALELLEHYQSKVQRALVDLTLPDTYGLLLAREIHERYPEIRIVLTTGGEQPLTQDFPFLAKPFSVQQLLEAMV